MHGDGDHGNHAVYGNPMGMEADVAGSRGARHKRVGLPRGWKKCCGICAGV